MKYYIGEAWAGCLDSLHPWPLGLLGWVFRAGCHFHRTLPQAENVGLLDTGLCVIRCYCKNFTHIINC